MSLSDFIVNSDKSSELDDSQLEKYDIQGQRKMSIQEYKIPEFLIVFFKFLDKQVLNQVISGYFQKIFQAFMN